ncbi:MAG: trimethylamine methyltransferase family protein [Clostridiales Family XIII bacterium]|jgi:trimethylamine--corrinoid protein Co-methyltransferase|nr:trimethylamine methyltransferase family protein [Clostridiales Family XIII bacterium]
MHIRTQMLDKDEQETLHRASLEVLEDVGMDIGSESVRGLLAARGARVTGENVRFPAGMTETYLQLARHEFVLAGRTEARDIRIPSRSGRSFNTTTGYVPFYRDEATGQDRPATSEDLRRFSVLSDALDAFDYFWPIILPSDVPEPFMEYRSLDVALRNTTKHVQASTSSGKLAHWQIECAALIAGGKQQLRERPLISLLGAPTTPLAIEKGIADSIVVCAQHGIPIVPMSLPQMGSTSPATVAANAVMANAEVLGCYLVAKCADEDAPVIYAADTGAPDMKTFAMKYDNPEFFILSTANQDMARYYGMPSMVASGMNESKDFSTVAGFERNVLTVVLGLLTRTDLACWFGSVNNSLSCSLVEAMLDVEVHRYAAQYLKEWQCDPYKLALDVIKEAGPRGNFLSHRHTFKNFKEEIATRAPADSYLFSDPKKGWRRLAEEQLEATLEAHVPSPLDADLEKELDALSSRALLDVVG